ncbi:hypothetical protein BC828DRAFT_416109 [Blastocladiella britannica]|nr:hypothetical protein BC828DRAFT_416109 [Blastocladiella britannica]
MLPLIPARKRTAGAANLAELKNRQKRRATGSDSNTTNASTPRGGFRSASTSSSVSVLHQFAVAAVPDELDNDDLTPPESTATAFGDFDEPSSMRASSGSAATRLLFSSQSRSTSRSIAFTDDNVDLDEENFGQNPAAALLRALDLHQQHRQTDLSSNKQYRAAPIDVTAALRKGVRTMQVGSESVVLGGAFADGSGRGSGYGNHSGDDSDDGDDDDEVDGWTGADRDDASMGPDEYDFDDDVEYDHDDLVEEPEDAEYHGNDDVMVIEPPRSDQAKVAISPILPVRSSASMDGAVVRRMLVTSRFPMDWASSDPTGLYAAFDAFTSGHQHGALPLSLHPATRLLAHLFHYRYPPSPLPPLASPPSSTDANATADGGPVLSRVLATMLADRLARWQAGLTHLWPQQCAVVSDKDGARQEPFYVVHPAWAVVVIPGQGRHPRAVVVGATRGLRAEMRRRGVPLSPVVTAARAGHRDHIAHGTGRRGRHRRAPRQSVVDYDNESDTVAGPGDNASDGGEDEGDDLVVAAVSDDDGFDDQDGALAAVEVEAAGLDALRDFLLDYAAWNASAAARARDADVPVLVARRPFMYSAVDCAKIVRNGSVTGQQGTVYQLQIEGWMVPDAVRQVRRLVEQEQAYNNDNAAVELVLVPVNSAVFPTLQ